jgi:hypothetical protein
MTTHPLSMIFIRLGFLGYLSFPLLIQYSMSCLLLHHCKITLGLILYDE